MPTTLTYPVLPAGYKWNMLEKIELKTGYRPRSTASDGNQTRIHFIQDLTAEEIADVDAIVGDGSNAQDPIIFTMTNNTYIVKDIYNWRDQLETETGLNIAITYRSSGNKGSKLDEIVVQATDPTYQAVKILTNPEKNALVNAIANLGRWE
jgi:hypothetical protein